MKLVIEGQYVPRKDTIYRFHIQKKRAHEMFMKSKLQII